MLVLTLLTRLPFLGHPAADYDEQLYSLIGQQMRLGTVPYVDIWDRKPIGLFLIYALAHTVGGDGAAAYQWLALAFCLAGALLVWRLATRLTASGTAAFACGLYPILMALYGSESGQSEIFFMPLITAMTLLVVKAREAPGVKAAQGFTALAMALGGLALQIKYTALVQCLYLGVVALLILRQRGLSVGRLVVIAPILALLGILPTALAALYYAHIGAWHDFAFANFISIGRRDALPGALTWRTQAIFALPLIVLAAGGVVYARKLDLGLSWWLMLGWLAAAVAGLFMGSTIYPYYYAALVPAVILIAMPMFDRRNQLGTVMLAGALIALLLVFNPLARLTDSRREEAAFYRITRLLTPEVAAQRHCLFVYDGPVALYRLTGSGLPTRFIYPDHLDNRLEERALPVVPEVEVARILLERPGAIVTTRDAVTLRNPATDRLVNDELRQHYRPLGSVNFQERRLDLYARRSDPDGLSPDCTDHR